MKLRDSGGPRSNITRDGLAVFDSSFCQIVHGLQVHPKFGAGVEEACQTQCRVCRHRALALHDSADACRWNPHSDRQRIDRHPRGLRNSSFRTSPGWAVTRLGVAIALVVVDDFDIGGAFLSPGETDAPLVIDADGMLAATVTGQRFEPVCGWRAQVVKSARGMEHVELSQCLLFYSTKTPESFIGTD